MWACIQIVCHTCIQFGVFWFELLKDFTGLQIVMDRDGDVNHISIEIYL